MSRVNRRTVILATVLCALVHGAAAAAQSPLLTTGARLEFVLKGDTVRHSGRDEIATRDSIVVSGCADCSQTRFAMNDFAKLDVLVHPKGGPVAWAVRGGVLGLLGGAIVGIAVGSFFDKQHCSRGECLHVLAELDGAIVGAPIGAVVGLTTGARRGRDRWRQIVPAR
jgi:hypothetical protein